MRKVPTKVDEEFRMSLVAMKDKLLELNKRYDFDFVQEAINYLIDVKELEINKPNGH